MSCTGDLLCVLTYDGSRSDVAINYALLFATGTLFIFGGCGADGRLADLHQFDMHTSCWTELPSPPGVSGRGGATLEPSADGKALWLAAGFDGGETNDLLRFCLKSQQWQRLPSSWLRPRSVASSFAFELGLMVHGGEVSPSDKGHEGAGGFAGDLVAIDSSGEPMHLVLADGEPAPSARGWAASATLSGSEGVLFGGLAGDDQSPVRLNDAWMLSVREL